MAQDKNYGKIDTQFESFQAAPAPNAKPAEGGNHNPGVQSALNEPADVGKVDYRNLYYTPRGPAPSIEGKSATERLDSTFEDTWEQTIAYQWTPPDSGRVGGTGAMESPMSNPLGMDVGTPPRTYTPTAPGDKLNYGGGQGPGPGATPPGPTMDYGGGQGS